MRSVWSLRYDFNAIINRNGCVNGDLTHETKSPFVDGANKALIGPTIGKRASCCADAGAERRFRYDAALPHRVEELILTDNSVAVPDKVNQQIEYLRLNVNN